MGWTLVFVRIHISPTPAYACRGWLWGGGPSYWGYSDPSEDDRKNIFEEIAFWGIYPSNRCARVIWYGHFMGLGDHVGLGNILMFKYLCFARSNIMDAARCIYVLLGGGGDVGLLPFQEEGLLLFMRASWARSNFVISLILWGFIR